MGGWVVSTGGLIVIRMLWDIFFLSLGCVHTTKQRQGIFFKTLYQLVVMLLKFSKASLSKKSEKWSLKMSWQSIQGRERTTLCCVFCCKRLDTVWWALRANVTVWCTKAQQYPYDLHATNKTYLSEQRSYLSLHAHLSYRSYFIQLHSMNQHTLVTVTRSSPSIQQQLGEKIAHQATPKQEMTPRP